MGRQFTTLQTPCLRVLCPVKGGAKSLYGQIIRNFTKRVGTPYRSPRTSADGEDKINAIGKTGGIAFIMIDETDNILRQGRFEEDTLSAFTRLNELAGIPLVKVGTELSFKKISQRDHSARRATGMPFWSRFAHDEEWRDWLARGLQYHLTKKPLVFTDEISELFYSYTQGVSDNAIALFVKSQELSAP